MNGECRKVVVFCQKFRLIMFKGEGSGCWCSEGKITTFSFVVREKSRIVRALGQRI